MAERLLNGWGRASPTLARVVAPDDPSSIERALVAPPKAGVIARGMGRSYGDAAQRAGGTVVDTSSLSRVVEVDHDAAEAEIQAGASLDQVMRALLPRGLFVPVTPGTRFVSVGGAIAADIHGKNHHCDGSFANHVTSMTLVTPTGTRTVTPNGESGATALFWATMGGMGLTGIVTSARFRFIRVETSQMRVEVQRVADFDSLLSEMERVDKRFRYSVAWIDGMSRGRTLGRGVITAGEHATLGELEGSVANGESPLTFNPRSGPSVPRGVPAGVLNRGTVRAFNEVWWRRAPKLPSERLMSLGSFFHPLDSLRNWNRLYGPGGFVQYQLLLPFGREDRLRSILERASSSGAPSFLGVLKRFGPGNPGPLSFPSPGWTLTLDFPIGPAVLAPMLDELDQVVVESGGRVYFAKDGRLRPHQVPLMYPRLEEWRSVCETVDPRGVLCSDLCNRLRLSHSHVTRPGVQDKIYPLSTYRESG